MEVQIQNLLPLYHILFKSLYAVYIMFCYVRVLRIYLSIDNYDSLIKYW